MFMVSIPSSQRTWESPARIFTSACILTPLLVDCVMVIGSEKGYIYPYDIMTDPRSKKVRTFSLRFNRCMCSKPSILRVRVVSVAVRRSTS